MVSDITDMVGHVKLPAYLSVCSSQVKEKELFMHLMQMRVPAGS